MAVFVVDKRKKPLMPCAEKRARLLLESGNAVVHRRYPFTIRLKERVGGAVQPVRLKGNPGAGTTGVALMREAGDGQHVLHLAELAHRSATIHKRLRQRAAFRRRRSANCARHLLAALPRAQPRRWLHLSRTGALLVASRRCTCSIPPYS